MNQNLLIQALNPQAQLVSQKSKPSNNTDVSMVESVLKSRAIKSASEEELKMSLKKIFLLVGLRLQHFPVAEEKDFIHQFIFENYGNKTLSEIELAFNLAIKGDLNLKPEDIKVYDQFTCEYFARIMAAYKEWLRRVSSIAAETKTVLLIEDKKELTPMEMIEWISEWKEKKEIILHMIPLSFYDFLIDTNMITISKEEKFDYAAKAADVIKTELLKCVSEKSYPEALQELKEFTTMETEGFTGVVKSRIQNLAKKIVIRDYLQKK